MQACTTGLDTQGLELARAGHDLVDRTSGLSTGCMSSFPEKDTLWA
jgi:hypothetical protein